MTNLMIMKNIPIYKISEFGNISVLTLFLTNESAVFQTQDNAITSIFLKTDGYRGLIKNSDVSHIAKTDNAESYQQYIITVLATFLYPEPNIKHPNALYLPRGSRVWVNPDDEQDESSDFIKSHDGKYVWKTHIAPFVMSTTDKPQTITAAQVNQAVAYAEEMLGVPYLWAGRTTNGCDCSGLVQVVYLIQSIVLPRDSWMQEQMDTLDPAIHENIPPVAAPPSHRFDLGEEPLQRGDLIFWKGHVGMMRDEYILLHASGHHMQVVSEPLNEARARITGKTGADVTSVRRFITTI